MLSLSPPVRVIHMDPLRDQGICILGNHLSVHVQCQVCVPEGHREVESQERLKPEGSTSVCFGYDSSTPMSERAFSGNRWGTIHMGFLFLPSFNKD